MNRFVHPLPLSIFSLNSTIFTFKKIKRGAEAVSSENGDTDFYGGEIEFKENGEINYGGDGMMTKDALSGEDSEIADGILASNTKKIEEMSGSIQDINTRLEKFDVTMKGVRSDSDGLRQEIVQINDSMKKMLCIYEAITQQYNPFIDEQPARRPSVPVEVDPPKQEIIPEEEPLDRIITPEDLIEPPNTLAEVVGLNGKACEAAPKKSAPNSNMTARSMSDDRVPARLFEDAIPATKRSDFRDACNRRMYDLLHLIDEKTEMEQVLERIFNRRLEGAQVPEEDLDQVSQWLERMRE